MTVLLIGGSIVAGVVIGVAGVALWFINEWDKNNPFG